MKTQDTGRQRRPLIVAHRGASHDAPENTLAAFRLAWQQDADAIEGDFRLTRDGHIVCLHDPSTCRIGDRTLVAARSTLARLRTVDVGQWRGRRWRNERIPTLPEVLKTMPRGRRIFIELKSGGDIVDPLARVLATSGVHTRYIAVIAFDADLLARVKQRLPLVKTLWLTERRGRSRKTAGIAAARRLLHVVRRIRADGVDLGATAAVNRAFMDTFRRADREVHVWTVDNAAEARRWGDLGAASITTNRPGNLLRLTSLVPRRKGRG